jgi:hypothetical protein
MVLSPQRYLERMDWQFAAQPNAITAARKEEGRGKWAIVFERPAGPNSRGGPPSERLEAIVTFTADDVRNLDSHEIRKAMIGVIAEREFHEVLEWAQLGSAPHVPIIDPHTQSKDLLDVVERVAQAMIDHAAI